MNRAEFLASGAAASIVGQSTAFTPSIRIAVVLPQSGGDAAVGRQLLDGIRTAIDLGNYDRGPSDRVIIYDVLDDRNAEPDARLQSSFATANPQVVAAIGHLSAAATLAALPTWAGAGVPLIVPAVTDDRLTRQGYRTVYRLTPKDSDEGSLIGRRVVNDGAKRIRAVTQSAAYGPDVADGVLRGATGRGVSADRTTFAIDNPRFDVVATELTAEHPDALVLAGTVADMGPLLPALKRAGYTGRLYASQGFFDGRTTSLYADAAEGLIVATDMPYFPLAPGAQHDVEDYTRRNGPLAPLAAFGFAAVQVLRAAMRRSQSTSRAGIARALTDLGPFDAVTGRYTFTPSGEPLDPNCYFYRVGGGKFAYDRQAHASSFMLK